jgi:hypothetical protein
MITDDSGKKKILTGKELIAWRQGFMWYVVKPPYKTKADVIPMRTPPANAQVVTGQKSAYNTIQALGGNPDIVLRIDMGIMDVIIENPVRNAGKGGAIRFKRDVKRKTSGDINLKGVKTTDQMRGL